MRDFSFDGKNLPDSVTKNVGRLINIRSENIGQVHHASGKSSRSENFGFQNYTNKYAYTRTHNQI